MIDAGKSDGVVICRWDGGCREREKTSWEEKRCVDLGWIDERKGITGFGDRGKGKRPGAGLVYVDVDVDE